MISKTQESDLANRTDRASKVRRTARSSSGQRGYTLLFAVFLCAMALLATTVAVPSIIGQGKREKELEMIWRGHQYEKAIGRYSQKFGHYPTKIDDLVKGTNGVRYLRQAYKDPMNTEDGSWRFIYVSGSGALFGSVKYISLQQMAALDMMAMGQIGGTPGVPGVVGGFALPGGAAGLGQIGAAGNGMQQQGQGMTTIFSGFSGSNGQNPGASGSSGPGGSSVGQGGLGQSGGIGQSGGLGQTGSTSFGSSTGSSSDSNLGQVTTIGGFIAGVGSKINEPSMIVYKRGKVYKQWEFIFNPYEQQIAAGIQTGGVPGSTAPGSTGFGQSIQSSPFGGAGQGPGQGPGGGGQFGQPTPPELPQSPNNPQNPQ